MAEAQLLGVDTTKSYSTKEFALGTLVTLSGVTYEFIKSTGGTTAYNVYIIDEAGDTTAFTHAAAGSGAVPVKLGIPQIAITAGEYGWAVRAGNSFYVNVLASCAADVKLYSSGTSGKLDDTSASQTLVPGLRINSADGGSGSAILASAAIPLAANLA